MFVRAYLRASTEDQNASRAKDALVAFAAQQGQRIAAYYIENESGASLQRPELFRLLADSDEGDVLLVEQVDRLSRLTDHDWQKLRSMIQQKGLTVVALDLPTSHQWMTCASSDDFTSRMLAAINGMLLDMLAAIARKDYDDRRRRQAEGIEKAKQQGAYTGRSIDKKLHERIVGCLDQGMSLRRTAQIVGCALSTVQRVRALSKEGAATAG